MSTPAQTSTLAIGIIDDVSKPALVIAEALKKAEAQARETAEALGKSGTSDKLQASLKKFGATREQIEGVAKAWADYTKAQGLAADRTKWTRDQINAVKNWEGVTGASIKAILGQERALEASRTQQRVREEADNERAAQKKADDAIREAERQAREQARLADQSARDQARSAERLAMEQRRAAEQDARDQARAAERMAAEQRSIAREEAREQNRLALQAERDAHKAAEAEIAEVRRAADEAAAIEQRLRTKMLDEDQRGADKRLAQALAAARTQAAQTGHIDVDALRQDQKLRAEIESEITADFRHQKSLRIAASQEEAAALDRIAILEKDQRVRAIQQETAAIVAAKRQEQEKLAEQQRHAAGRMGFVHYLAGGAAATVSAHGVVGGVEGAVEKGAELQHARIDMVNAGISSSDVPRLEKDSLDLSTKYANVSQIAIMELTKEVRSVLTKPEELEKVMPHMVAAKSVLDGMDPTGEMSSGLGFLTKAGESLGATQKPERFIELLNGWMKAMQVMGKTITPEQIYEFAKYSKTAGAQLSDRFLMTTGPSLIQELNGSTSGNDLAMLSKQLTGGLTNRHTAAKALASVGLIKPEALDVLSTGEVKGVKADAQHAVTGEEEFAHDPDKWVYDVLVPHMEAAGMKSRDDQLAFVQKAFTGTAANVISKLITQRESFEAHAKMYESAAGIEGALANNLQDATVQLGAFKTALGNLSAQITQGAMPGIGTSLHIFATRADELAQVAQAHPAAALVAGGAAAVGGLAASGWLGWKVMNGFGLGTAATALDGSAALLSEAAIALGAKGGAIPGGIVKGAGTAAADAAAGVATGLTVEGAAAGAAAGAGVAVLGAAAGLIVASHEAQKPGGGGAYAPATDATRPEDEARLADLHAQLADAEARIAEARARSTNADTAELVVRPLADQVQELKNEIALLTDSLARLPPAGPPIEEDRATRARSEDAPKRSLWHRIFGAGETGIVPASYTTGDRLSLRAGSSEAEALIERGTHDGVWRAFQDLRDGASGGGTPGLIDASYEDGGETDGGGGGGGSSGGGGGSSEATGGSQGGGGPPSIRFGRQHARKSGGGGAFESGPGTDANTRYHAHGGKGLTEAGRARVGSWMNFFMRSPGEGGMGLPRDKAAAMVGMMQGESGQNLDPSKEYWDYNGPSGGTAAWHDKNGHGRLSDLKAFAAKAGKDWRDMEVQQQFWKHEAETTQRRAWNSIVHAADGREALRNGVKNFEVPRDIEGEIRKRMPNYDRVMRGDFEPAVADKGLRNQPTDNPLGLRKPPAGAGKAATIQAGLEDLDGAGITPAVDNKHLHQTAALLDHIHGRIASINAASARGGSSGSRSFSPRRSFMSDATALT